MKQRIFSGIQPSGNLHIGNYLGAVKQWVGLQDEYESIFCVVDMHAITVPQDPKELRAKTLEIAKIYLAAGIDPAKSSLFVQSHVPEHAELAWILNTVARMGELRKMTQYKEKSSLNQTELLLDEAEKVYSKDIAEHSKIVDQLKDNLETVKNTSFPSNKSSIEFLVKALDSYYFAAEHLHRSPNDFSSFRDEIRKSIISSELEVSVGLFDYPVLMAADILLYDTAVVPVGDDQLQHVELTRTLARRFNDRFGETFRIPEARIMKEGARIMGLDDPTKKMSKSATSGYNAIALTDDAETIRKKIKKAVTDSGSEIVYQDDPVESDGTSDHGAGKPALKNLINIYTLLSGIPIPEIEKKYEGKGYGDFKADLAEVVVEFLTPFQERMAGYSDEETLSILREGADRVRPIAAAKLKEAKERVGFLI